MDFRKSIFTECVGAVTVILQNGLVLQGQFAQNERRHCDETIAVVIENVNNFVSLTLTCEALTIDDDGVLRIVSPTLFSDGDVIRINTSQITAIGPSHGCPAS